MHGVLIFKKIFAILQKNSAGVNLLTKIFLIRHGETAWNKIGKLQGVSDVELSPEGIKQARLLAEHAPFNSVDAIYSSDLIRAVKTAEILAQRFNLPVIKNGGLRETSFGTWEGKLLSDLAKENPQGFENFFSNPDKVKPPQGETFLQSQARIMNALNAIIADNEGKNIIVVSHGAAIRLIICAALGISIGKMWAISQHNTALNILNFADGHFSVELLNGTLHLYNF